VATGTGTFPRPRDTVPIDSLRCDRREIPGASSSTSVCEGILCGESQSRTRCIAPARPSGVEFRCGIGIGAASAAGAGDQCRPHELRQYHQEVRAHQGVLCRRHSTVRHRQRRGLEKYCNGRPRFKGHGTPDGRGSPNRRLAPLQKVRLQPWGLSFHVGSQQRDITAWDSALSKVSYLFTWLKENEDLTLSCINMGGGFPATYRERTHPVQTYADEIKRYLEEDYGDVLPEIIIEPGRSFVGDSGRRSYSFPVIPEPRLNGGYTRTAAASAGLWKPLEKPSIIRLSVNATGRRRRSSLQVLPVTPWTPSMRTTAMNFP